MYATSRSGFRRLPNEAAVGDTIRIAGAARLFRSAKYVIQIREKLNYHLLQVGFGITDFRGEPRVEGGDDPIFMERTFIADRGNMQDLVRSTIIENLGGFAD